MSEDLEIRSRANRGIKMFLGGFVFLVGVIWFFIFLGSHKILDIIISAGFIFSGLFNFIYGFGLETSVIKRLDNGLDIKWADWIMVRRVRDSDIDSIYLKRTGILIKLVNGKSLRLKLDYFKTNDKAAVYKFFLSYSQEKGLNLLRHFDS